MERSLLIHDPETYRGAAFAAAARLCGWEADYAPTRCALEDLAATRHRHSLRHGCIMTWCEAAEVSPLVHGLRGAEVLWEGSIVALVPKGTEDIASASRLGGEAGPLLGEVGAVTIRRAASSVAELLSCIRDTHGLQIDRWLDALAANDIIGPLRAELNALAIAQDDVAIGRHCDNVRNLLSQANLDLLGHAEATRIRKALTRAPDIGDESALRGWVSTARDAVRQLERAWMKSEF